MSITHGAQSREKPTQQPAADGKGYDPTFLGTPAPVQMPAKPGLIPLTYTHFTIRQDAVRRLPAVTAVNIDGPTLVDVTRGGESWALDPRLFQVPIADGWREIGGFADVQL